ncbi:hypothetical protein ACJJTC_018755 [Scirpophaga incertulas]
MCTSFVFGISTLVTGAILVIASAIVSFAVIPDVVENSIVNEVVLNNNTIQMERFEEVPFPLNFTIRVFNITNAVDVLNGAVPVLNEIGPYVYKLNTKRLVKDLLEDQVMYKKLDTFEFDAEASFPNTEDDIVHIGNIAYHGVLQIAEAGFSSAMSILNRALPGIFGTHTEPIMQVRVGDLLLDGIKLCENPDFFGTIACALVRQFSVDVKNMEVQNDLTINFSALGYRNGKPSEQYNVYRGLVNPVDLGRITEYGARPHLPYWKTSSVCNMINGTDSGIFHPFVNKEQPLYSLNTDICRSVELRYQNDVEYKGVSAYRFTVNEWFLDNSDGCYCLNLTRGINRPDGCLYEGAMELYSCLGAFIVLSYPHFLYADQRYSSGVMGLSPVADDHRIYLDIEPNTGTVVRGAKRAQFNVFMRPVNGIANTEKLRTTLTPIFWVEESFLLPNEYAEELNSRLLSPLKLIDILIPVALVICSVVFLVGLVVSIWARTKRSY